MWNPVEIPWAEWTGAASEGRILPLNCLFRRCRASPVNPSSGHGFSRAARTTNAPRHSERSDSAFSCARSLCAESRREESLTGRARCRRCRGVASVYPDEGRARPGRIRAFASLGGAGRAAHPAVFRVRILTFPNPFPLALFAAANSRSLPNFGHLMLLYLLAS
jgi:hypothetical protein